MNSIIGTRKTRTRTTTAATDSVEIGIPTELDMEDIPIRKPLHLQIAQPPRQPLQLQALLAAQPITLRSTFNITGLIRMLLTVVTRTMSPTISTTSNWLSNSKKCSSPRMPPLLPLLLPTKRLPLLLVLQSRNLLLRLPETDTVL